MKVSLNITVRQSDDAQTLPKELKHSFYVTYKDFCMNLKTM